MWQLFARALCDTRNIGKLTKDQFALAIYLIQQKLKGVDPPAKLPPEMIPPSIRRSSLVVCFNAFYYCGAAHKFTKVNSHVADIRKEFVSCTSCWKWVHE